VKRLFYVHGLGGSLHAQPEIEAVFAPAGFEVIRVPVPYHNNPLELLTRLATLTFPTLCRWMHDGAETLIHASRRFAPEEYVVIGDSMGGFISVVAAQRDYNISHCVLLACSGDICDAAIRLPQLNRALALVLGRFTRGGPKDFTSEAQKAAAGESSYQGDFELVNTLKPERLLRIRRLLMLGDKGDPVAPEAVCRHFAERVEDATVRMVYNEGRHHPIGKDALASYALPFLRDQPIPSELTFHPERKAFGGIQRFLSSFRGVLRHGRFGPNRPPP